MIMSCRRLTRPVFACLLVLNFVALSNCLTASIPENAVLNSRYKLSIGDATSISFKTKPTGFELLTDGTLILKTALDYETTKSYTYAVSVTRPAGTRDEQLTITVLDVNDVAPKIVRPIKATNFYPNGLPENATAVLYKQQNTLDGAVVYCVEATDVDTNANLTFDFFPTETMDVDARRNFRIVPHLGCILRKGNTNLTAKAEYNFPIRVRDMNSVVPQNSASYVQVTAYLNPQPPQIGANPYVIEFEEGTAANTKIGVLGVIPITNKFARLSYSLTRLEPYGKPWPFTFNNSTGEITVTRSFTFNRDCKQEWHATLVVTESGTKRSSTAKVSIVLTDKNDHRPFFQQAMYFNGKPVLENATTSEVLLNVIATDQDTTSPKDLKYALHGANAKKFQITTNPSTAYGEIRRVTLLDYETLGIPKAYPLQVTVTDGIGATATTSALIYVENVNDNAPVFSSPNQTTVQVQRDQINQVVYQAHAYDADGSTITYYFKGRVFATQHFTINSASGAVNYIKKADSKTSEFKLIIVAYDKKDCTSPCTHSDTELKSTELHLTVKFLDKNTMAPIFTNCPPTLPFQESKKKGDVVYRIQATDSDLGLDGIVVYELKPNSFTSNPETYVTVNSSTGVIALNRNYDRESDSEKYNGLWAVWITVMARDSGTNQLRSYCTMRIDVQDVNDNPPAFDSNDPYVTGILNTGPHSIDSKVIQVFAIDPDEFGTVNSIVVYEASTNFPSFLKIDSHTGWISFKEAKNSFSQNLYSFQVTARNSAPMVPSTSSSTVSHNVKIYVVTSTDMLPPTVNLAKALVEIPENFEDFGVVISGQATAAGALNAEPLAGNTLQTNKGERFFRLFLNKTSSPFTFSIRKNGNIDATFVDHVYFHSRLTRVRGNYGSGTETYSIYTDVRLLINVTDVNNRIPSFIIFSIDRRNRHINLPENSNNKPAGGVPVTTLFAADKDVYSSNRQISYSIMPDPYFIVVGNAIYTRNNVTGFDFEGDKKRYPITVIAQDGAPSVLKGVAPLHNSEKKQIQISITDVNDNPPYFNETSYNFTVPENAEVGKPVYYLKASDIDTVSQNSLVYSLKDNGIPFGIDAKGGYIYPTRPLNYDAGPKVFTSTVTVFDGKSSGSASIRISLTNVKDNPPVFNDAVDGIITALYPLGSASKTLLKRLNVTDTDMGSGTVSVTAEGHWTANHYRYFSVLNTKDLTVVNTSINPTESELRSDGKYHFTLKAIDGTLVSYAQAVVTVEDKVNRNPPCFDIATLNGFQLIGKTTAMTVKAKDTDKTPVTFSIPDAGTGFTVDPKTGVVSSRTPPVASEVNQVAKKFNITASDGTKSTTGVATVTVIGENLQKPSCLKTPYTTKVAMDVKMNQIFFVVIAGNLMAPDRRKVKYSLKNLADKVHFGIKDIPALDGGGLFLVDALPDSARTIVVTVKNAAGISEVCNVTITPDPGDSHKPMIYTTVDKSSVPETAGTPAVLATPILLATFNVNDTDVNDRSFVISLNPTFNTGSNPGLELQTINATQARLLLIKSLDREKLTTGTGPARVMAVVTARDTIWKYRTATTTFTLTVTDVPETPTFPTTATPYVSATASVGTTVTPQTLSATPTGKYTYSKDRTSPVWTSNPPFNLESLPTGDSFKLTTARSLASETNPTIAVPIIVSTMTGTPLSTVSITVGIQTGKLPNIVKQVRATVSYGWSWYWTPSIEPLNLGSIYGLPLFGSDAVGVTYALTTNKFPNYFSLNTTTGDVFIIGSTPAGNYSVVGTVKRGSLSATATMNIEATTVGLNALSNIATLRLNNINVQTLVQRKSVTTSGSTTFEPSILDKIRAKIAELLPTTISKVQIVSVENINKGVNVYYVASGSPYYTATKLNTILLLNKAQFESIPGVKVGSTPIDKCAEEPMKCSDGCTNEIKINQEIPVLDRHVSSTLMGMTLSAEAVCGCGTPAGTAPKGACGKDSCLNEGNCTVSPGTKTTTCTCPATFEGPRCQQLYVNFGTSDGYLFTDPIGSCGNIHISFEFVTKQSGRVLLLYTGPLSSPTTEDRLAVELNAGVPQVSIIVNGNSAIPPLILNGQNPKLNDGKWHRIDVWYNNGKLQLMSDRCENVDTEKYDGSSPPSRTGCHIADVILKEPVRTVLRRLNTAIYPIQVGGSTVKTLYPVGLIGGMGMLRVNGVIRNLVGSKLSLNSKADSNTTMTQTCYDAKKVSVCGANSICRQTLDGTPPLCTCKAGYRKDTSGKCTINTKIVDYKTGSYTVWRLKSPVPDSKKAVTDFSIMFRTRRTFGTILYLMGRNLFRNQSLELRLHNSQVVLTVNIGDFSYKDITVPNKNVSDGAWHMVQVSRYLNSFEMLLDGGDANNYVYYEGDISSPYNYMKLNQFIVSGLRFKLKTDTTYEFDYHYNDLNDACLTDMRLNGGWIPFQKADQTVAGATADVYRTVNRGDGCPNTNVCPVGNTCVAPLVCLATIWRPLTIPSCSCPVGFTFLANLCIPLGVCSPNPCIRGTCSVTTAFTWGYRCTCPPFYRGQRCEIFAGAATASLDAGIIALIVIVILLIIIAILLYCFCVRYRRRGDKLLDYPDEDTRENVCHYDEEGAGEEDHGGYDLTHLRKPIHDDITPTNVRPVKSAPPHDNTDLGNFLHGKLKDAEHDPHGPPQDYSLDYGYEGQGSVVDDLSSLGSGTSDGSQHYDHLHKLGPKFKPLHELYNHNHKA